jgi:hypothetical protein
MVSQFLGEIRDAVRLLARFPRRREAEQGYVAPVIDTVAASGGTLNIHLENPTDKTVIDVEKFIINPEFKGRVDIYDSFSSAPTGGDGVGVDNLRMDEAGNGSDGGDMAAAKDVSYTADSTHLPAAIPGGGSGAQAVGEQLEATAPLIDPGREIVVEITNESDTAQTASIAVVYTEVEQPL